MAGINLQRLCSHTPLKSFHSASAPFKTFNGNGQQIRLAAQTVGQLSAPPPEAVALQADQRTDNKVISIPLLPAIPSRADLIRLDEFTRYHPRQLFEK